MVLWLFLSSFFTCFRPIVEPEINFKAVYFDAYRFSMELESDPIDVNCKGINSTDNIKKLNPVEYPDLYIDINDSLRTQVFLFLRRNEGDTVYVRQTVRTFDAYYITAIQITTGNIEPDYDFYISGFLVYPKDSKYIYFLNTAGFIKMSPSPPILRSMFVRSISILDDHFYTMVSYTFDVDTNLLFVSSPTYQENRRYKHEILYNYFNPVETNFSLRTKPTSTELLNFDYKKFNSTTAIDCKMGTVTDNLPYWFYNYNSNEYCW